MLTILSALLFALSCNVDNLVIGIAYGTRNIRFSRLNNLLVAVVTTIGTFLSMNMGEWLARYLSHSVANGLGAGIMFMLGVYFVAAGLKNINRYRRMRRGEYPPITPLIGYMLRSDQDHSGHIDIKEAWMLALGLTISNIGTGIAASMTGGHLYWILVFNFLLSMVALTVGIKMGKGILGRFMGKYGSVFAGLMLMVLGLIEWLY